MCSGRASTWSRGTATRGCCPEATIPTGGARSCGCVRRAVRGVRGIEADWARRIAEELDREPDDPRYVRLAVVGLGVDMTSDVVQRLLGHERLVALAWPRREHAPVRTIPDGQRERIRRPLRRRRRLPAQRRPQLPGGHRLRRQRPRDGRHVLQVPATERPAPGARDRRGGRRRRPSGTHTHTAAPTAPGGESPANPRGSACHLEGTDFACLFAFWHLLKSYSELPLQTQDFRQ